MLSKKCISEWMGCGWMIKWFYGLLSAIKKLKVTGINTNNENKTKGLFYIPTNVNISKRFNLFHKHIKQKITQSQKLISRKAEQFNIKCILSNQGYTISMR